MFEYWRFILSAKQTIQTKYQNLSFTENKNHKKKKKKKNEHVARCSYD